MAAAEAKLDAKIKALNGLKAEVNGLLSQSNANAKPAEIDRLVKVFEGMKAKDAARAWPRWTTTSASRSPPR